MAAEGIQLHDRSKTLSTISRTLDNSPTSDRYQTLSKSHESEPPIKTFVQRDPSDPLRASVCFTSTFPSRFITQPSATCGFLKRYRMPIIVSACLVLVLTATITPFLIREIDGAIPVKWIFHHQRPWRCHFSGASRQCCYRTKPGKSCDINTPPEDFKRDDYMRWWCQRYAEHHFMKSNDASATHIYQLAGKEATELPEERTVYVQMYQEHHTPTEFINPWMAHYHYPSWNKDHIKWDGIDCHTERCAWNKRCHGMAAAHQWCLHNWFPARPGYLINNPDFQKNRLPDLQDADEKWMIAVFLSLVHNSGSSPFAHHLHNPQYDKLHRPSLNRTSLAFTFTNVTIPHINSKRNLCFKTVLAAEAFACASYDLLLHYSHKAVTLKEIEREWLLVFDYFHTNFTGNTSTHTKKSHAPGHRLMQLLKTDATDRLREASKLYLIKEHHLGYIRDYNDEVPFPGFFYLYEPRKTLPFLKVGEDPMNFCLNLNLGSTTLCWRGDITFQEARHFTLPNILRILSEYEDYEDPKLEIIQGECHTDFNTNLDITRKDPCRDHDIFYEQRFALPDGRIEMRRMPLRNMLTNGYRLTCPRLFWHPYEYSNCFPGELVKDARHLTSYHPDYDLQSLIVRYNQAEKPQTPLRQPESTDNSVLEDTSMDSEEILEFADPIGRGKRSVPAPESEEATTETSLSALPFSIDNYNYMGDFQQWRMLRPLVRQTQLDLKTVRRINPKLRRTMQDKAALLRKFWAYERNQRSRITPNHTRELHHSEFRKKRSIFSVGDMIKLARAGYRTRKLSRPKPEPKIPWWMSTVQNIRTSLRKNLNKMGDSITPMLRSIRTKLNKEHHAAAAKGSTVGPYHPLDPTVPPAQAAARRRRPASTRDPEDVYIARHVLLYDSYKYPNPKDDPVRDVPQPQLTSLRDLINIRKQAQVLKRRYYSEFDALHGATLGVNMRYDVRFMRFFSLQLAHRGCRDYHHHLLCPRGDEPTPAHLEGVIRYYKQYHVTQEINRRKNNRTPRSTRHGHSASVDESRRHARSVTTTTTTTTPSPAWTTEAFDWSATRYQIGGVIFKCPQGINKCGWITAFHRSIVQMKDFLSQTVTPPPIGPRE